MEEGILRRGPDVTFVKPPHRKRPHCLLAKKQRDISRFPSRRLQAHARIERVAKLLQPFFVCFSPCKRRSRFTRAAPSVCSLEKLRNTQPLRVPCANRVHCGQYRVSLFMCTYTFASLLITKAWYLHAELSDVRSVASYSLCQLGTHVKFCFWRLTRRTYHALKASYVLEYVSFKRKGNKLLLLLSDYVMYVLCGVRSLRACFVCALKLQTLRARSRIQYIGVFFST